MQRLKHVIMILITLVGGALTPVNITALTAATTMVAAVMGGCGDKKEGMCYEDGDGDGYGDRYTEVTDPVAWGCPRGTVADSTDCNDVNSAINPGADEDCDDGVDSNCDKSDNTVWYHDGDGDGYGHGAWWSGEPEIYGAVASCDQPTGYVADNTDCHDGDATIHPGAEEVCDGVDNDCDDRVDESGATDAEIWYKDNDADGYGDEDDDGTRACDGPDGYVANGEDCNDDDAATNPGVEEVCGDGRDNNCDGRQDGRDNNCD